MKVVNADEAAWFELQRIFARVRQKWENTYGREKKNRSASEGDVTLSFRTFRRKPNASKDRRLLIFN
ncbi:hypothetical protein MRX96_030203 [Rhipicephalus microplus]